MIDKTRKKLREALFFCLHVGSRRQRSASNDPEEFIYYLSAFLSAARSVEYVLRKEEKEKYDAWFGPWLAADSTTHESKLLDVMKIPPVAEVHPQGATTIAEWEAIPIIEVVTADLRGDRHPAYGFYWFSPTPPNSGVPIFDESYQVMNQTRFFELGSNKSEVIGLCERYTQLLTRMVQDFMAAHPAPLP